MTRPAPGVYVLAAPGQVPADAVTIDTGIRWDKAGFLAASARAFNFPPYFGFNWDALADSLSDVTADDSAGLTVAWRGWGPMARMYPDDFAAARAILGEFVERQQEWGTDVVVVLVGPGPDTGLPVV